MYKLLQKFNCLFFYHKHHKISKILLTEYKIHVSSSRDISRMTHNLFNKKWQ